MVTFPRTQHQYPTVAGIIHSTGLQSPQRADSLHPWKLQISFPVSRSQEDRGRNVRYFTIRRRIPTRPIKPVPNSQTAAGMGTGATNP